MCPPVIVTLICCLSPQGPLVRWLKVNFSEAFIAWIHIKALRVFVESVLRYCFSSCNRLKLVASLLGWSSISCGVLLPDTGCRWTFRPCSCSRTRRPRRSWGRCWMSCTNIWTAVQQPSLMWVFSSHTVCKITRDAFGPKKICPGPQSDYFFQARPKTDQLTVITGPNPRKKKTYFF